MDTRKVSELVRDVAEKISRLAPGTVVTHTQMCELLGCRGTDNRYYRLVNKLRSELEFTYGVFLRTEHTTGYTLCLHGDEITLCHGEMLQGVKKMYRSVARTQLIRVDRINDPEKKSNTIQTAQKMASIVGMLKLGGQSEKLPERSTPSSQITNGILGKAQNSTQQG